MHLPLRDRCFNGVFMFDVLEHIGDVDRVLKECRRILRERGKLLILSPNTLGLGFYDSFADPTHTHHFTWYTIKKILLRNGFKIIDRIPLHLHITWPLRRINKKIFRAIQQSICIVCERV
jgi:ubiquinone/menaquinone biosynthesis C-methylase UbiE